MDINHLQVSAQELIDKLGEELKVKKNEAELLKGAIQGVNLFYSKIVQQESAADEQSGKVKNLRKKSKAKG